MRGEDGRLVADAPGRFFLFFPPPPSPPAPHPPPDCLSPRRPLPLPLLCVPHIIIRRGGGWHAAGGGGGAARHPHLDGRHRPPRPCLGGGRAVALSFCFDSFAPSPPPSAPPSALCPLAFLVCSAPAVLSPSPARGAGAALSHRDAMPTPAVGLGCARLPHWSRAGACHLRGAGNGGRPGWPLPLLSLPPAAPPSPCALPSLGTVCRYSVSFPPPP